MGTPTPDSWPGVEQLPDYKATFPTWTPKDLAEIIPNLEVAGIELLEVIFGNSVTHQGNVEL